MFKRGLLDYGETIEEIFVDLAKPFKYDIAESETKVFARNSRRSFRIPCDELPDVLQADIQRHQLKKAFVNEKGLLDLVQKIITSNVFSSEYDEFQMMKYMLAKHAVAGRLKPVAIPEVDATNMKQIAGIIKGTSNEFEFMTDKFNVAGVKNYTEKDKQFLIVNTSFDATMDVEVLASALTWIRLILLDIVCWWIRSVQSMKIVWLPSL